MRLETFEKRIKEVIAKVNLPSSELAFSVDPYGKKVTVKIYGENTFCVAENDMKECYRKALRILKAYAPKATRVKKAN